MLTFDFAPFPTLTTQRLVLRQLSLADAAAVYELRADPRVMQFIPRPLAQSVEDAAPYIDQVNRRTAENELINWASRKALMRARLVPLGTFRCGLSTSGLKLATCCTPTTKARA